MSCLDPDNVNDRLHHGTTRRAPHIQVDTCINRHGSFAQPESDSSVSEIRSDNSCPAINAHNVSDTILLSV